jgi:predicted dehydrogenase
MAVKPMKVGIIGCGAISATYLGNSKHFEAFDIVAVADLRLDAAQARAKEFDIPKACSVEDLLANPEVELVINLTSHKAHGPVGIAVLEAGKHVYNEKPFAVYREQGQKMLELCSKKGLRAGAAPDTFFGGAWQTARKLIDEGAIGEPIGAFICLMARWGGPKKPSSQQQQQAKPEGYVSFYSTDFFEFGVTWSFDRGPYYMNAIVNLLGPVKRVTASAKKTWDEREGRGGVVEVKAPTHIAGIMDFANGAVGTYLISADVFDTGLPHIEIYGSDASLRCIDPNNFGGQIYLRKHDSNELQPVECPFGYNRESRGVGIADMATAIRNGRPHRASGEMGYHVIDIIHGFHDASNENKHIMLSSTCKQPAPLPLGLEDWTIDD